MEAGWHSAENHTEPDLNSNEMAAQLGFILPLLRIIPQHPRPAACGAWGGLAAMRSGSARASRGADVLNGISMTWEASACQNRREHSGVRAPAAVGWEQSAEQPWLVPASSFGSPHHFPGSALFWGAEGGRGRVSPRSAVAVATAVSLAAEHTFLAASPSVSC